MGCTLTPKPVSLSSHAIQGLSAGLRASTARLVMVSLVLATRFPGLDTAKAFVHAVMEGMTAHSEAGRPPAECGVAIVFLIIVTF